MSTETARHAADGRIVIGVEYDADTAVAASAEWGPGRRHGLGVRFAGTDGAGPSPRGRSVNWACSTHVVERFTGPELHVTEPARVLTDSGTAFVIRPNRPNEILKRDFSPSKISDVVACTSCTAAATSSR